MHDLVLEQLPVVFQLDRALTEACKGCKFPTRNKMTQEEIDEGLQINTEKFVNFFRNNFRKISNVHETDAFLPLSIHRTKNLK